MQQETSHLIDARRQALAEAMTARQYAMVPELEARYGERGRVKCVQDALFHLSYLSQSVAAERPALFADYVAWAKVMLAGRGIPPEDLAVNLACMRAALEQELPAEMAALACAYVEAGETNLPRMASTVGSFIIDGEPLSELARDYLGALLAGERQRASRMILEAVEAGASVRDVYLQVFQRAQYEIGRLWQMNLINVAQEHYCTAATQLVMSQLYPRVFNGEKNGRRLVATCVGGDLHEIGVRMVSDLFEMDGWDTFYLGANTPASSIIQALATQRADILAVSATISTYVNDVARLIGEVRRAKEVAGVRILVGGYPFNIATDLWQQVGADSCAANAVDAVNVANRMLGEGKL
ncbi:MAG TPA: cobalamin-dependent protein [Blastocatellia bacterium]|nr:cobalamin-dependent protein [Blastocatellia bacterium]